MARSEQLNRARWFLGLAQDLRTALRLFASTPLVSAVAVLSLGLGIGATTATFSLINSVYLRPLPVDSPEELVSITGPTRSGRAGRQVAELLRDAPMFERLAAYTETQFDVSPDNEARWVDGLWVGGTFFETMGVAPFAGRLLSEADDIAGGGADGPVAVISHSLWQRRFASAPDALGRSIDVNHTPFTIVGVAPPDFFGPNVGRSFDVALPLSAAGLLIGDGGAQPGDDVIARLRTGQTLAAANAALQTWLTNQVPADRAGFVSQVRAVPAATGLSPVRDEYRQPLAMVLALGALVLLVAAANVANLMLAWATVRRHELSVRRALGASSWRLVRQCSVESFLLAAVSAMAGVLVAVVAARLLVRGLAARDALTTGDIAFGSARLVLDAGLDWRVWAFTTGLAVLTALLFGIAPALRSLAAAPVDALKESTALTAQGGRSWRFGAVRLGVSGASGILVAQVALSLMLVVSAGLFVRSFSLLSNVDIGIDAARVLLVNIRRAGRTEEPMPHERILDSVRGLPSVAAAGVSLGTPPISSGAYEAFTVVGADPPENAEGTANLVTPEWFAALGMRTVAGRLLTGGDVAGAPRVAVVNEAFATTFVGTSSAIGRTISSFERPIEIVGVVGNVISGALGDRPQPAVYLPLAQADGRIRDLYYFFDADRGLLLTVRSATGSPTALTRALGDAVQRVEPGAVLTFRPLDEQLAALTARERVLAMLSTFFGVLALLLAALGLYGLVAYTVARQRREMAIRLALGAPPAGVVAGVLGRVLALIGIGTTFGAALSAWSGKFLAALLYGVQPTDVSVFLGAALILTIGGAAVAWLPARHAARIDPATALRYE
ncbi:MAG TPA: ADOP family duplicated permease [Gammaproteobacteria bacterium]|nr:ADOP family duplicated permease [Gammaproteobacteria bacterium]